MPYKRPTVAELMHQQSVDLSAQLGIAQSQISRSNAGVMAKVQAGGLHGLYGYLAHIIDQQFEDTADAAHLQRRANIRGIKKKLSTKAAGRRIVTGNDGVSVDAGIVLQRADGERFIVTSAAIIEAGSAQITVTAETAGKKGNTAEGEILQFITPIAGISSTSLTGVVTGGADDEDIELHRARVLIDIRQPPQGGADRDYRKWTKETPGVSVGEVWPMPKWMGAGTVGVFFILEDGSIPDLAAVDLVQAHVQEQAPVTADVYVMAPNEVPVDIQISGLSPNTQTVKDSVKAELSGLFIRAAQVENGSGNATVLLSHIREAISIAAGESDHVLVTPTGNLSFVKGDIPRLGVLT